MKLFVSAAILGLVVARPNINLGNGIPGGHAALSEEEGLGAGLEQEQLSNSEQKHLKAIAEKEAIIAAKKLRAQQKAERFQLATEQHEAEAQAKKAAFEASKLAKEAAKAAKEAAEAIEAAAVKAAKDAKQAVKEAAHAAQVQKALDQKDAVQANAEENEAHVAAKFLRSLESQLKTCNVKLRKFKKNSGKNPATYELAQTDNADGFTKCIAWRNTWETLENKDWNYEW